MELAQDMAVIKVFEEIIKLNLGLHGDWYIGVTDEPQKKLMEHEVDMVNGEFFHEHLSSAVRAVFVKDYFIKQGLDGQRDKFNKDHASVYIYKKNSRTIP